MATSYVAPYQQAYASATFSPYGPDPSTPSSMDPPVSTSSGPSAGLLCLAITCPPLAVFRCKGCSDELAFCIVLTLFGIFPGILYAILLVRQDAVSPKDKQSKSNTGSRSGRKKSSASMEKSPMMSSAYSSYQAYQQNAVGNQGALGYRKASVSVGPAHLEMGYGRKPSLPGYRQAGGTGNLPTHPLPGRRPSTNPQVPIGMRRPSTIPGLIAGPAKPSAQPPLPSSSTSPARPSVLRNLTRPPSSGGPGASGPGLDVIMEDILMSDSDDGSLIDGVDDEETVVGSVGAMDIRRGSNLRQGMFPGDSGPGSVLVDALPTRPPATFW